MDKLERYYNYIVDDLVNDTKFDHEDRMLIMPFTKTACYINLLKGIDLLGYTHANDFSTYVQGRYGIRSFEVPTLWNLYKEKVLNLYL
jgi:hypothetical protein